MVQNTLKQKAREFAKAHGVPYLTALKAVDEPLHELRDLMRYSFTAPLAMTGPHFRLIGSEGIYSSVYRELPPPSGYYRDGSPRDVPTLDELGFSYFSKTRDIFKEIGRRMELIDSAGAQDIWGYRELYRAGILADDAPELEVFLHYSHRELFEERRGLYRQGAELGLFVVILAPLNELMDPKHFPVTQDQLKGLFTGSSSSAPIWMPLHHVISSGNLRRYWSKSYSRVYSSKRMQERSHYTEPIFRIFLEAIPSDESSKLKDLGFDLEDFIRDESLENVELKHTLGGDMIDLRVDENPLILGSSQTLIFA